MMFIIFNDEFFFIINEWLIRVNFRISIDSWAEKNEENVK